VHASDTGGRLKTNTIDVFIGEGRMAKHARRLGVQQWKVGVCEPEARQQQARAVVSPAPVPERTEPGGR
jgi:hypothetical protein